MSPEKSTGDRLQAALDRCQAELVAAKSLNSSWQAERLELAALVEGSRDAIWSWDTNGSIRRWNAAAQHLFGYVAQEIIGTSLLRLVPPEHIAKTREAIQTMTVGASYGNYETVRLRKDGTRVDVELTVSPIVDATGSVVGASTVCRDITERKHFQASLAKRFSELTTLDQLSERLQAAKTLPEVYTAALDAISHALCCDCAAILLFDMSEVMRFVAWRGLSEDYRRAVDGHSPWNVDTIDPEPVLVADILSSNESAALKETIVREGIRALAFVPLVTSGRLIGKFMAYHREPHDFTDNEVSLATTIGRQLALSIARRLAEEDLRQSEARFRLMAENAPVMIWISDAQGKCLHLNQMLRAFWGVDTCSIGDFDWTTTMHPDDAPEIGRKMMEASTKRSVVTVKGRYLDARGHYRILETRAHPRLSNSGEFMGMIGANVDVTEREEAERARELLVAELNHRVKNTLSIVQGIAHQTFRSGVDPDEARRAFEGRLITLAHAHNLLTRANWENASLEELAEVTLDTKGVNAKRVSLSGPQVMLSSKEAVSIAMALHELCTNARKYGALSNERGRVSLDWRRTEGSHPQLRIHWIESGGPPVSQPARRGFGSLLLERTLARDLDGEVMIKFEPGGIACSINAPLERHDSLQ